MTQDLTAETVVARCRQLTYALLITVTAGLLAGRILSAELVLEPSLHRPIDKPDDPRPRRWPQQPPPPMPTFSSNDRSRWATIRALVDHGTYAVGQRVYHDDGSYEDSGIVFEPGWGTVDKVLHPTEHVFYSSKPPLLPTLLAGEYWLLQELFGWTLADDPFCVVRAILFTVNWLPMILYLLLLSQLVDRFGRSDWGRLLVMTSACLATFLSTFAITLNNHTVAATAVVFALFPLVRIWLDGGGPGYYAFAGLFAAWTACNELPAVAFTVLVFVFLLAKSAKRTLLFAVPTAAIPVAAFFLTNYLAIGEWLPAYTKFGTVWYEYPGSHWANPKGIDAADEPLSTYALHLLVGHHGLFSLTPLFLLSLAGMIAAPVRLLLDRRQHADETTRFAMRLTAAVFALSLVVVTFYLLRTNNYGGWTSGPRWFFWLTPLWLLAMLPVTDRLAKRRFGRAVGYFLLLASAVSVGYSLRNPWRHPWIYDWLESQNLIHY